MQSSFTAQSDGTYVRRIRTRQEPTEVTFALGSYRYLALLAHLREFFPGQYLPGEGDEDGLDREAPRLRGGGLRGGEDPGYGTADSGDALPGTKDGVQAVAAELRVILCSHSVRMRRTKGPVGSSPEALPSSLEQQQRPPWKEDPG